MATSGTYTHSRNRDQIISRALRIVGAIAEGETPGAQMVTDAQEALNAMCKAWQATGIHIWRSTEGILFLQADQTSYSLGSSSADHATESFVETSLSAAAASGAATFDVASASGLSAGQYIGIELDSGSFQWTTISSIASTTVTPAAALTGAAASGNRVVAYTTKLVRPLSILSARRYNFDSAIDTPLMEMDRAEYYEMPNKTAEATITGYYYDRRGGANSLGRFFAWPEPPDVNDAVKFTFARPIQDFSAAANNPDFPDEWIQALVFNLALTLAPEWTVPLEKYALIEKNANQHLALVQWFERENEGLQLVPDIRC